MRIDISFEKFAPLCLGIYSTKKGELWDELTQNGQYDRFIIMLLNSSDLSLFNEQIFDDERIIISSFDSFNIVVFCISNKDSSGFFRYSKLLENECLNAKVTGYLYSEKPFEFSDISRSLRELFDAYNYDQRRRIATNGNLYVLDKIHRDSTIVPPVRLKAMIQLFERGKFDELEAELDSTVDSIRTQSYYKNSLVAPTSIKRFFVELILFIIHAAYDRGVDVDEKLCYADPYQTIFSFDETPDIKNWCMETMRCLYREFSTAAGSRKDNLADSVEHYIKLHLEESDISVNSIAEAFKLSPAYLSNCYSTIRGNTIVKYILNARMETACSYLKNSDLTINEIFHKVGFLSESYFYSAFKKKFGVSPAAYRKNQQ